MKEILINCGIVSKTAAILEDGDLTDVLVEQTVSSGGVGNIYKGTVDNVVPGMQSAFVDIGLEKNAFLYAGDIEGSDGETDIRKLVKKGQDVIVQITKEAQGVKGARVTTGITLPGHFLVLMPYMDYVGISKKITDENEKERLKAVMNEIREEKFGYIVRTDAQGATREQLQNEIAYLSEIWKNICKNGKVKNAPALLYDEDSLLLSVVRDYFDESVDKLIVNEPEAYEEVRKIASVMTPALASRIQLKEAPLFLTYGIENKLKKLLQRKVWLDSGAYLIMDYTEALTVIDVNTGKFTGDYDLNKTILKTNIQAAKEIARQLRLRAIGGIIVVDFIDMESEDDRKAVLDALEEASRGDKVKTNILGFAPLGLVELTRKKTRLSLAASLQCTCPYCEGDGLILNENAILNNLLGELKRLEKAGEETCAVLRLNPYLVPALKKYEKTLKERFPKLTVFVREDGGMHMEDFNISFASSENDLTDHEGLIRIL